MTSKEFWRIVDDSRGSTREAATPELSREVQLSRLESLLRTLPPDEVVAFERNFINATESAREEALLNAAYLAEDGSLSSDDSDYFLYWLVSRGQETYSAIRQDPDKLAGIADETRSIDFEDFSYVAADAYKVEIGQSLPYPIPGAQVDRDDVPFSWSVWPKERLKQQFPKLWDRFVKRGR